MVDQNISDLFFNTDLSSTHLPNLSNGMFAGYDEAKLQDEALMFLSSLARLGVDVPTSDDLLENFHARL